MKEYTSKTELKAIGTESLGIKLRDLYEGYGYSHFKMSKFEEYDLYAQNKDFLQSDSIITFTDRRGKLLALKPDITLSIIKNSADGKTSKYYYNENVYRIRRGSDTYGEFLQLGVECIGDVGIYETAEMLVMAAKSLEAVSDTYILDISSMGILESILSQYSITDAKRRELFKCVAEKSLHGVDVLRIDGDLKKVFKVLIETEGPLATAIDGIKSRLPEYAEIPSVKELESLADIMSVLGYGERVRLDFSVVHDRTYYNGIVMRGFVKGVPERVLSGGRYDLLMRRMGKKGGGIGFSVYADALERLYEKKIGRKTDVLILASREDDVLTLTKEAESLRKTGLSVSVLGSADSIEYERLMKLADGILTEVTE